jgi:hypothetical protein
MGVDDFCSRRSGRRRHSLACLLPYAGLLLALSDAMAHDIRGDADPGNDWIEGLVNGKNAMCCGANDCYPLRPGTLRTNPDGYFEVAIGEEWFLVPALHLVHDSSPDGRAWACPETKPRASGFMYRVQGIRCLLLPKMM